jgi:hypothetical protein
MFLGAILIVLRQNTETMIYDFGDVWGFHLFLQGRARVHGKATESFFELDPTPLSVLSSRQM